MSENPKVMFVLTCFTDVSKLKLVFKNLLPTSKQIKTYLTWLFGCKRLQIKGKCHSLGLKTLDNRQEGFPSDILATLPTHPIHSLPSQPLIKPARHLRVGSVCRYYGL